MDWGCFFTSKTGPLMKIDRLIGHFDYRDIIQNAMLLLSRQKDLQQHINKKYLFVINN